jgi:hypothetical protein
MPASALTGGVITADSRLRSNGFRPADLRSYHALFVMDHFLGRQRADRLFKNWRGDLKKRLLKSIQSNGPGRCLPLPRIQNLDRETFFKEFVAKSHPVVFEGAALDWECCRKWNFEWIKQRYGGDEVMLVERTDQDRNPLALGAQVEHLTLADLIDGIDHGSLKYARFHPLLKRHPELRQDLDQKWLTGHLTNPHTSWMHMDVIFLGGKGTETSVHNDAMENLFIQVHGQKRWRLYPVQHTPIFDPPANRSLYKYTSYNPTSPDEERYPMTRHMDYYETVLQAGDVLYCPPYYWHHVSNPVSSIGVGWRWNNMRSTFRASPFFMIMEGFNTNPNLVKGIFMSLKDFNKVLALDGAQQERHGSRRA